MSPLLTAQPRGAPPRPLRNASARCTAVARPRLALPGQACRGWHKARPLAKEQLRVVGCRAQSHAQPPVSAVVNKPESIFGRLYLSLLPGPLRYAPSLILPVAALLAILGAEHGHEWVQYVLTSVVPGQLLDALPVTKAVQELNQGYPGMCDALVDIIFSLAGGFFSFVVMPAGDLLLGREPTSQELEEGALSSKEEQGYRMVIYTFVVAHWAVLLTGCHAASTGTINPAAVMGLALSLGCMGGILFSVAHELVHSPRRVDKALAAALLCSVGYMHWAASHLAHHRKVATADDPASARLRESLYSFVPRSVLGNLSDGFALEMDRLRARRLPFLCPQNRTFRWVGIPAALLGGVWALWGPAAAAVGVAQALMAIFLLENVNYIEHYGLQRMRTTSGMYERTSVYHSWNADWMFTNSIVFRLQRHSDHHAHASRPFWALRNVPEAPQLPASYPAMMILALVPDLFFRLMDPRISALRVPRRLE